MIALVDTETTGLDPDVHEVWEVGLILYDEDADTVQAEYSWQLPAERLGQADAKALEINGFYHRRAVAQYTTVRELPDIQTEYQQVGAFATRFARLTWGCHWAGMVPSFDEERLRRLLRANGACPGWHYHLIDVETLAVGKLMATSPQPLLELPWSSESVSLLLGVDPDAHPRHYALGDARWSLDVLRAVRGVRPEPEDPF